MFMNIKSLRHIFLSLSIGAYALNSWAVPAKPGLHDFKLSDGSSLNLYLRGDENFHQYFTEDGYPVIFRDNAFYYCDYTASGELIDSGIKVVAAPQRDAAAKAFLKSVNLASIESRIASRASKSPRLAKKAEALVAPMHAAVRADASEPSGPPFTKGFGLVPGTLFPAYGHQKAIVILVEYPDARFSNKYEDGVYNYFNNMLNEDGFSDSKFGGTGSCAQYFKENSNGAFIPEFDLYGPIMLSNPRAYYGGNDKWGEDLRPHEMIIEACQQLDATVDFREYDRNGDGIIDNVYVFYAGLGENDGGSADTVWPHSWDMRSAGAGAIDLDGVRLNTYGCSNEWTSDGRPTGVGTFIHEFSHVIGLPDLYSTNYSTAFTPGDWSVLDYGNYNNEGMTPPNYGAFERYALGWGEPLVMESPMSVTFPSIESNSFGIIHTEKNTEFFLFENRQQQGWDSYIPGHGMLVWHIDYNRDIWDRNAVNNSASHQYVDIVEADNTRNDRTVKGDSFPGSSNVTSFTSSTMPAMKSWSGLKLDYPVTDISEEDGLIRFDVCGGGDPAGVGNIGSEFIDIDGKTEYFTLSGVKIDNPAQGQILIRKRGSKIDKIIF